MDQGATRLDGTEVVKRLSKWGRYSRRRRTAPDASVDDTAAEVGRRAHFWLGRYRRMSQDCEYRTEASEAFIYAATVRLMLGKAGANVSRNRLMRAFRCPLITFYGSARTYKVSNRDANGLTIIYAKSALAGGAQRRSSNTVF